MPLNFLSNIGSMYSAYRQAKQQSKLLSMQSEILEANARGTRNQANSQANAIEDAARKNQRIAADNLMSARANQREKVGQVKAARAGSGFTSEDSGSQAVDNAQAQLDKYIGNMAFSAAVAMSNAFQASQDTRKQGEIRAFIQETEADQYKMQAKAIKKSATISLAAGLIEAGTSFVGGFMQATEFNAELGEAKMASDAKLTNAWGNGEITWEQMQQGLADNAAFHEQAALNPWNHAFSQASYSGAAAYHSNAGFSSFISSFSADANSRKNNWGGPVSVLDGNVPYKVPSAGTIFSNYI